MRSTPGNVDSLLAALSVEARSVTRVPAGLRDRVSAIPDQRGAGQPNGRSWFLHAGGLAVAVSVLAVVAVLISSGGRALVGVAPPPIGAPAFDPSVDGPGILTSAPADQLSWIPWVVAAIAILLIGLMAWRRRRALKVAAAIAVLGVLAAASVVVSQPGLGFGNAWGSGPGVRVGESATDDVDERYVVASPGQSFLVTFNIVNEGNLPLRVLGVVEEANASVPRWTAVGSLFDQTGAFPAIAAAQPFEPLDLQPNETLLVYLAGRASDCAFGPEFVPPEGSFISKSRVRFAFSVLGLTSESPVDLAFALSEPQDESCTQTQFDSDGG